MNQSQFLAITFNSLEGREKSRVHGAIGFGFGFGSYWLKNSHDSFKPITKRSNRNHVITFDSHLKTALTLIFTHLISGHAFTENKIKYFHKSRIQFPKIKEDDGYSFLARANKITICAWTDDKYIKRHGVCPYLLTRGTEYKGLKVSSELYFLRQKTEKNGSTNANPC